MFKDRTTATVSIVAVIALILMGVAMVASSSYNGQLAQQTADAQTALAPTNDALTQAANIRQETQAVLNATAAAAASQQAVTAVALATNAAGDDVQTTASGLQYRVITEGTGPKPAASDTVTVNYRGILPDGTEFDSSYSRGEPTTFQVNRVISGWTEALQLMSVGSKYIFIIPPELGYGAAGSGGVIPPNATLIFEIELLAIPSQPTSAPMTAATTVAATSAPATPAATPETTSEAVIPAATEGS